MKQRLRKKQSNSGLETCPLCKKQEYLVEHHIHGRKIADFNADWNLSYICPNCHNKVHRKLITIIGWFMSTEGRTLIYTTIQEAEI